MSRNKVDNTNHAYLRAAERCGWNRERAKKMMRLANRYGKTYEHIEDEYIATFLEARQLGTKRRIKYYCGFIFVFARNSTKCYTVYKYEGETESEQN